MAGLGRRTFAAGEVLTASNVMGYLQDQAVMNFAGTAARGTALGTAVSEGMVSYLADSNAVQVYDGSSWLNIGPSGRIAQIVTAATNSQVNSTTSTFVSTGLTASITPTSSTSKLIVIISQNGIGKNGASTTGGMNIKLQKDTVDISTFIGANTLYDSAAGFVSSSASFIYTETSGSTTSRTFRTVFNLQIGTGTMNMQRDGATSTMIILEVIQ